MDILLAKYKEGAPLDLRMVSTQQGEYITELRNTGFIDFVPSEQPMAEPGKAVVETLEVVNWFNRGISWKQKPREAPKTDKLCPRYQQSVLQ